MGFQFSKLASLKLSGWLYDLFGEIKNREFSEVFQPYWSSIDHEHVNCLVRVEHVSGSLLANDTAQTLRIVLGVEDRGREGLGAHVSTRVWQKVTVVAVVIGKVGQLVEDQVVNASDLVPLS